MSFVKNMDLQLLDQRTRKLRPMHGVRHLATDVDRLYTPCIKGAVEGYIRSSRRISLYCGTGLLPS